MIELEVQQTWPPKNTFSQFFNNFFGQIWVHETLKIFLKLVFQWFDKNRYKFITKYLNSGTWISDLTAFHY